MVLLSREQKILLGSFLLAVPAIVFLVLNAVESVVVSKITPSFFLALIFLTPLVLLFLAKLLLYAFGKNPGLFEKLAKAQLGLVFLLYCLFVIISLMGSAPYPTQSAELYCAGQNNYRNCLSSDVKGVFDVTGECKAVQADRSPAANEEEFFWCVYKEPHINLQPIYYTLSPLLLLSPILGLIILGTGLLSKKRVA